MRSSIKRLVNPIAADGAAKAAKDAERAALEQAQRTEAKLDHDPSTNPVKLSPQAIEAIRRPFGADQAAADKAVAKAQKEAEVAAAKQAEQEADEKAEAKADEKAQKEAPKPAKAKKPKADDNGQGTAEDVKE